MLNLDKKNIIRIIFLVSSFVLISAYFIEYILGHQPCKLCLIERLPYASALFIIILNYNFGYLEKYFIILLALIFCVSVLLSLYHLGIEQGFIEESLVCDLQNNSTLLTKDEILQQLKEKKVSCKDVTFKIFGLSLTFFNIMISLLLTTVLAKLYLGYETNK